MCRVISFLSSKGGVGKTSLIYVLSKFIARSNKRVLVMDGYFAMNDISTLLKKNEENDFKEYLIGTANHVEVLNTSERGLLYLKTNKTDFDYVKHKELIKKFIHDIKTRFDFVLIDVNNQDFEIMDIFLTLSNEVMLVMGDSKSDVMNAYKIIYKTNNYKNITNTKLIINKARIISEIKGNRLNFEEIEYLLKHDVLFVIPKFIKWNYFNYKNITKIQSKIIYLFCNSFITNKSKVLKYKKYYSGVIGFIRKKIGEKYE